MDDKLFCERTISKAISIFLVQFLQSD